MAKNKPAEVKFQPQKFTVEQLKRQLALLNLEVDEKVTFTKKELLIALTKVTKNREIKAVKVTKNLLKDSDSIKKLGFKVGDIFIVFDTEKEEAPATEEKETVAKKKGIKILAFFGKERNPVIKIDEFMQNRIPHVRIFCLDGTQFTMSEEISKPHLFKTK